MSATRERTLADWESNIPELIDFSTRDLQFLLIIQKLETVLLDDEHKAAELTIEAWQLIQENLNFELDKERFMNSVAEGWEFIHGPDFDEYQARFSRYLPVS